MYNVYSNLHTSKWLFTIMIVKIMFHGLLDDKIEGSNRRACTPGIRKLFSQRYVRHGHSGSRGFLSSYVLNSLQKASRWYCWAHGPTTWWHSVAQGKHIKNWIHLQRNIFHAARRYMGYPLWNFYKLHRPIVEWQRIIWSRRNSEP